ncbi:MAG: hypothetical protein ABI343_14205 [Burkholderiaceae bacterium]
MQTKVEYWSVFLRLLLSSVLVLFGAIPTVVHAAAAAMVTDLQGKASVSLAGRSFDATILSEIEAGAQVQLPGGTTLVVLYLDGGREYAFKGPAQILFRPTQPELISGVQPEVRSPSLGNRVRIKPVGLAQGSLVMRKLATPRIRLLSPSGTRVLEGQPDFHWQELQPGLKYQIEVADETGRSLVEAQVDSPSFKMPVDVQLKEGAFYTWAVSARLPDGRKYLSMGEFSLASAELREQAIALRVGASEPVSSRVAYATWLDQMELKDEARKYWRTLSSERPEDMKLKALADQ